MTQEELKALDLKELKAMAYDQFALVENAQNNLKVVNQVIAEKAKEKKPEAPKE